ncbi:MAG: MoxR family ATPase [Planctomycetota bacterium]|nr:MAG: MoxR family ATPase [Planctomycetota bacterium]
MEWPQLEVRAEEPGDPLRSGAKRTGRSSRLHAGWGLISCPSPSGPFGRTGPVVSKEGPHAAEGGEPVATETTTLIGKLEENVARVVLGKPTPIRLAVIALLAEGHVLIEDAPGVGKTSLAKGLARSLSCDFRRLQCTPDMLPSDVLGSSVYLPNLGEFEFRKGPVFTNILLADEINRTTPRTQSALLEAMEERQVSVEGNTYPLPRPFFVIATQNPFEFEGTFPLPENQLDRFTICTEVGYPDRDVELEILKDHRDGEPVEQLQPVMSLEQLRELQAQVRGVRVEDDVAGYLLDIVGQTRDHPELVLGVSPRGSLTLYRTAQAMALCEQRDFVVPDDVKKLVIPVLAHRVVCKGMLREGHRRRAALILRQILDQTPVPQ